MSYIIIASPFLLPGGRRKGDTTLPIDDDGTILLGARLTKWSPAAGRTVKRSGLRDTGGVYLVSVYRARSGNIHRAVGQDFVLNVDDILYFTGMVQQFAQFCENHGLEVITNEVDVTTTTRTRPAEQNNTNGSNRDVVVFNPPEEEEAERRDTVVKFASTLQIDEFEDNEMKDVERPDWIETRSQSGRHLSAEASKQQAINRLTGECVSTTSHVFNLNTS